MCAEADREAKIRALLPLVKKIARRVRAIVPGADIGDLVGDGSIGLIRAVDQFDEHRGPTLEQYARRLIAGAMLNGVRRMDPVSERARRAVREGEERRHALAVERGALPTLAEMERIQPNFRRAVVAASRGTPLSLDAPLPERERLAYRSEEDPANIVVERSVRADLAAVVDCLPERQRMLMRAHYYAERPLREVGRAMGISPQRASQLHLAAIERLRKALRASLA